ncbi:hypothetical protein BC941DRAFT_439522 [Chlamydoabsidia padenii]|nr:hypothetical protein BC941DRAFT_439522 [Chlamydoabsidia padenii]
MIPLDTASIEEELVRDDFQHKQRLSTTLTDFNSHQHRCYSTITQSCGSNNDDQERSNLIFGITCNERDDYSIHQLDHSSSSSRLKRSLSRRHWKKFFTRWISTGHDKKTGKPGDKDNDRQHSPTETAEPIIHPTGASTSQPQENNQTNSATIDTLPDRENDQRQTRKPARHVSWSVGTSYEEYKRQKANMVEQGLYGLSNANIARALGGSHRGSKASLLFRPELTSSQTSNPSTPTPQANTSEATGSLATKPKDSGLLFVQQTLLSTKSLLRPRKSARWKGEPNDNDDNTEGGINRRRNSTDHGRDSLQGSRQPSQRRRSTHIMERYSPKLSALEEEDIHGVPCPTLVAFRYPKMVRMKDLRDAAIHILSVTDEDGIDTGQRGANSSGDGDRYKQKV